MRGNLGKHGKVGYDTVLFLALWGSRILGVTHGAGGRSSEAAHPLTGNHAIRPD